MDAEDDKDSSIEHKPGVDSEEVKDSETKDKEIGGGESKTAAGLSQDAAGGSGEGVSIMAQEVGEEGERPGHPEGGATAAVVVTGGQGAGDSKADEVEDKGDDDSRDSDVTEGQDVADTKQVRTRTDSVSWRVSCHGRVWPQ